MILLVVKVALVLSCSLIQMIAVITCTVIFFTVYKFGSLTTIVVVITVPGKITSFGARLRASSDAYFHVQVMLKLLSWRCNYNNYGS